MDLMPPAKDATCPYCAGTFVSSLSDALPYCSEDCRWAAGLFESGEGEGS